MSIAEIVWIGGRARAGVRGRLVEVVPDRLDVERIAADQRLAHADEHRVRRRHVDERRRDRRRRVRLAVAADALVGVDADDERVLRAVGAQLDLGQPQDDRLDVGDPHLGADHARAGPCAATSPRLTRAVALRLTPGSVAATRRRGDPARHCMHPHEHRLTRRNLVRGALGAGAALGVAGVAAGCANTTTAVGSGCGRRATRQSQKFVVAEAHRAERPAAAAHRQQRHLGDHRRQPADQGRPQARGRHAQRLQLRATTSGPASSSASRSNTTAQVKIATYNSADEAAAKLAAGAVDFDVVIGLSANQMVGFIAQQLMLPLNHSYLPNLAKNIWPALQDPFYDRGARYTRALRRLAGRHRLAQRQDRQGHRRHEGAVGHLLGGEALDGQGRPAGRRARRAEHADAARRDAHRRRPRPQHRRRGDHREGRRDLAQLTSICNIKVTITDYQTLPEAKTWLHHSWSGDLAQRRALLPAQGHEARRALVLGPRRERRRAERHALDPAQVQEAGARARVPQLHARQEERLRQLRAVQRLLAAAEHDRRRRRWSSRG